MKEPPYNLKSVPWHSLAEMGRGIYLINTPVQFKVRLFDITSEKISVQTRVQRKFSILGLTLVSMHYLCYMADCQGVLHNIDLHTGWPDPQYFGAARQSGRASGSQLAGRYPAPQQPSGVQGLQ